LASMHDVRVPFSAVANAAAGLRADCAAHRVLERDLD
jgi:hypothetical protein